MDIVRGDVEQLMNALGFNIALMIKHFKNEGIDLEKMDNIIGETVDFIKDRAQSIENCGALGQMDIINMVVMVLMHATLRAQEAAISSLAAERGVNRDVLADELLNETIWGMEKK